MTIRPSSKGVTKPKLVSSASSSTTAGLIKPGSKYAEYDLGWDRIVEGTHVLSGQTVIAGAMDAVYDNPPQTHPAGGLMPTATVGTIHEFGLGRFRSRPFMRESFDSNRALYVAIAVRKYREWQTMKAGLQEGLSTIGAKMVTDIKKAILLRDDPVFDTGQLYDSIKAKIKVSRSNV